MNRETPYLQGGSLEITRTVPLITKFVVLDSIFASACASGIVNPLSGFTTRHILHLFGKNKQLQNKNNFFNVLGIDGKNNLFSNSR